MKINNEEHATFTRPGELRLTRLLPGPIERVWEYLTNPQKRARWFAGGLLEQKAGGQVALQMRHSDFAPGENPPKKYKEVHERGITIAGRVIRCEPPHLLVFTFGGDDSEVTFELKPQGNQVLLMLTHVARGEDLPDLGNFATGWHLHISVLIAELEGKPQPGFWTRHDQLLARYTQELSATAPV